jgi:hypothetical protein
MRLKRSIKQQQQQQKIREALITSTLSMLPLTMSKKAELFIALVFVVAIFLLSLLLSNQVVIVV